MSGLFRAGLFITRADTKIYDFLHTSIITNSFRENVLNKAVKMRMRTSL